MYAPAALTPVQDFWTLRYNPAWTMVVLWFAKDWSSKQCSHSAFRLSVTLEIFRTLVSFKLFITRSMTFQASKSNIWLWRIAGLFLLHQALGHLSDLSATMDEQRNETFDTSGILDKLQFLQVERFAMYHDSNSEPWKVEWSGVFCIFHLKLGLPTPPPPETASMKHPWTATWSNAYKRKMP